MSEKPGSKPGSSFTLRPSLGFRLLSVVTPLLLLAIGVPTIIASGRIPIVAGTLTVLGIVLGAVALFDVPSRVDFDSNGVRRVCPLRTKSYEWAAIRALTRPAARPRLRRRSGEADRRPGIGGVDHQAGQGGLLLELDSGRRLLLSSGKERLDEYALIEAVVAEYAPGLAMPGPPWYPKTDSGL